MAELEHGFLLNQYIVVLTKWSWDSTRDDITTWFDDADDITTWFDDANDITTWFDDADDITTWFDDANYITTWFDDADDITTWFDDADDITTRFDNANDITTWFDDADDITTRFDDIQQYDMLKLSGLTLKIFYLSVYIYSCLSFHHIMNEQTTWCWPCQMDALWSVGPRTFPASEWSGESKPDFFFWANFIICSRLKKRSNQKRQIKICWMMKESVLENFNF